VNTDGAVRRQQTKHSRSCFEKYWPYVCIYKLCKLEKEFHLMYSFQKLNSASYATREISLIKENPAVKLTLNWNFVWNDYAKSFYRKWRSIYATLKWRSAKFRVSYISAMRFSAQWTVQTVCGWSFDIHPFVTVFVEFLANKFFWNFSLTIFKKGPVYVISYFWPANWINDTTFLKVLKREKKRYFCRVKYPPNCLG
jgi:hypothetical protein